MENEQEQKTNYDHMFEYKVFPWQNSNDVDEQYRNEILITTLFILKKGTKKLEEKRDESKQIPLKTYVYQVINDEQRFFLEEEVKKVYHHMPIQYYDHNMYVYENQLQFNQIEAQINLENWVNRLPPDQQVYQKFSKATSVGCEHYIRGCQVRCETCQKYFPCRICHNNEVDDHEFPRFETKMVKCNYCHEEQPLGQQCIKCKRQFASYFCEKCRLLCDTGKNNKPNYHCEQCGHCMVGLRKYTKHCTKCNGCINSFKFDKHKCIKMEGECIVCLQDLKDTTFSAFVLECNHLIHTHCYQQLLNQNIMSCPICKKFLPIDNDRKMIIDYQKQNYYAFVIPYRYYLDGQIRMVQCNDCLDKFPQVISDLKLYYCNKCKLYNCTEINQYATHSDFQRYYASLPPDALMQNIGNEETIINKIRKIWKTDDIKAIENDIKMPLTNMTPEKLYMFTWIINKYPKSAQAFLRYLENQDLDDSIGEEEEQI